MAKVQYGSIITDMSGSIGGITFQKNRSGSIARLRSGTRKNTTPKQSEAHALHTALIREFSLLTLPEKQAWDLFADANPKTDKFGTERVLTGQNMFESLNYWYLRFGFPLLKAPPIITLPTPVPTYNILLDTTQIGIEFAPPFEPASNSLIIFTTPPTNRVTQSMRPLWRFTIADASPSYSIIDFTTQWEEAHGIDHPAGGTGGNYNIGVLVMTICNVCGFTSVGTIQVANIIF